MFFCEWSICIPLVGCLTYIPNLSKFWGEKYSLICYSLRKMHLGTVGINHWYATTDKPDKIKHHFQPKDLQFWENVGIFLVKNAQGQSGRGKNINH